MLNILRPKVGLQVKANPATGEQKEDKRGLVLGELLVAFVLLAVAISSLTALMYSVTRNPRTPSEAVECTEKGSATSAKCVAPAKAAAKAANAGNLLVSGCATRKGAKIQVCTDSVLNAQSADATTIRSRTDSASLEKLPKKPRKQRTDLGFIR